ncbi:hypothetical protein BDB01DRAFT_845431 [Pilobolus umbonatus]|nr:hypothetical protein BDB01DRAFT_845431 [Pilobolus umbonatus]
MPTMSISKKLSLYHLEYVGLALLFLVNFCIIQSPTLPIRLILAALLVVSFWIPYIRHFTFNALPIFAWLITFYSCQFIPLDYRPTHIFVNILPTLERILYGANLSEIISKHTHPVLDILAWIPYGVVHFSFPFVLSLLLFIFGPPGSLRLWAKAFGYMNLAGVLTQLLFPNASPWYEIIYGSAPADYSIPGEAGGLLRIDDILGLDLYSTTFGSSPLVFGAFPSLHSGCATIEMLFVVYLCPRLKPLAIGYVLWMWFATMYLTHHYMIDLVGGSIYALLAYVVAHNFLPKVNSDNRTRLAYLGITKISIRSFVDSIEHDPREYQLPMSQNEVVISKPRPEPLNLQDINEKRMEECSSSASSFSLVGTPEYWSPTSSEPHSPITPHTPPPIHTQLDFGNCKY